ncbi:MAG: hypothetical protein ACOC44_15855 [Promethearchaeia archaeon]
MKLLTKEEKERIKRERERQAKRDKRLAYRRIVLKDPRLRNLRLFLREVITQAYFAKKDQLWEKIDKFREENKDKEYREVNDEYKQLGHAYSDSIIDCEFCQQNTGDRIYVPYRHKWYCLNCYENDLPKYFRQDWKPFYPFGKQGVFEFYRRLKRFFRSSRIHKPGVFGDTRWVLMKMGVPKPDQRKFIKTLKEYGGHNDGEILMNTWPKVREDFGLNEEIEFYI